MQRFPKIGSDIMRPFNRRAAHTLGPVLPSGIGRPPAPLEVSANPMQMIGFALLCVYLLAGLANEWSFRLLGQKAYLSLISGATLPLVCLFTGIFFRPLTHWIGRWWLAFFVWLAFSTAFSFWRSGSLGLLMDYGSKSYLLFFYVAATTVTLKSCVRLFHVQALGALIVLLSCMAFGDSSTGRLSITGSLFFDNPNDLAIQLLISAWFMLYLILSKNKFKWIPGYGLIGLNLYYLLKTASRGTFLALVVCLLAIVVLSEVRFRILAFLAVCALIALISIPRATLVRLVNIALFTPEEAPMQPDGDYESQMLRLDTLSRSLRLTASHPVFGVGPGMFAEVVDQETRQQGVHNPYLGTHNSYAQIASETGLPGLFFYTATLTLALTMNWRLVRRARGQPALAELNAMAFATLIATIGYAAASAFHHLAYTRHLPLLAGMTLALWTIGSRLAGEPPLGVRKLGGRGGN
jgi:O-antigen ligase